MSESQQEQFAAYMRQHLPKPEGEKYHHPITIFTDFSSKTLGRPIHHWRDMTVDEARAVMKAAAIMKKP